MTFRVFDVKSDWHTENGESVHFLAAMPSGQLLDRGLVTLK